MARKYRKQRPNLREIYELKEQQAAERRAEEIECERKLNSILQSLREILNRPEEEFDPDSVRQVAQECQTQAQSYRDGRKFVHLGRHDFDRIWNCAIEAIRLPYRKSSMKYRGEN